MSDDNGISWFKKAMQDTKPLKEKNKKYDPNTYDKKVSPPTPKPKEKIRRKIIQEQNQHNNLKTIEINHFYTGEIELNLSPECFIEFKHSSINQKMLKNIKQNNFFLDSFIDLHGYTIYESANILREYIINCLYNNERFIKIITGKGQHAKLKNYVAMWLKDIPYVLAFSTAPLAHGSTGAFIVYLNIIGK